MSKKTTVSLGSALNIMQVAALKPRLSDALAKNLPIVLIAEKVEKVDTAGLQLIYSFIQKAQHQGGDVSWQKPTDTIYQASELLGMSADLQLTQH